MVTDMSGCMYVQEPVVVWLKAQPTRMLLQAQSPLVKVCLY